jgi:hypothetical protein
MEVSGEVHGPAALPLVKGLPVTIGLETGCAKIAGFDAVGLRRSFTLAGNRTPVVQLVASRCTN